LVDVHLKDLGGMVNLICWLPAHNVEDLYRLGVRWVDHSKDVRGQRDVALVQELYSKALVLGRGNELALVGVDIEVLACIDKSEVFGALYDQEYYILDIEDEGRGPVHDVVDKALTSGADDQMVVLHAHVDHSFSEVKIVIHLVEAIVDSDLVFLIENSLDMGPREGSVNDVSEDNLTVATCTRDDCAIVAPGKAEDRARLWLVE
jgi:hypothetical protein